MKKALEDYASFYYQPSDLYVVIQLNVLNAIAENANLIGFPKENLCRDDYTSPFHHIGPHPSQAPMPLHSCPANLQPTYLQRTITHHPWIDLFPYPNFRDNILHGIDAGLFEEDDLCYDILGGDGAKLGERPALLVWTKAWDPRGWELSTAFLRKWGMLVEGCPDLLEATNYWRNKRGQESIPMGFCAELDDTVK
jgi:hypothetical protein